MLGITILGLTVHWTKRRALKSGIADLAREWNMHYAPDDRFRLADRVAEMLPIPGAAHVELTDVIYGNEADGYRYVFCAWFTEGVIHSKRRCVRVATFHEPGRPEKEEAGAAPLIVAPEGGSILHQYRQLREKLGHGADKG